MTLTIMRRVPFCAGHRLKDHEGKCAHLHGHNYVAEFYISSDQTDAQGRIVDFAIVNRLFKGWIDDHWDHGFLLWDQDREAIQALQAVDPCKLFLMPYSPTAENIARYLLMEAGPFLLNQVEGYQLRLDRVVIWENENSCAEAQCG
ncbi:MAG TPA: 6-carboxytetrahydropterin synthase [Pirellulaceae bacterium]|nr:6-carboxytetrahydropterin synthase [Pirellulaceae bacterium]